MIPVYSTFEEKNENFRSTKIDKIEDFKKLLLEHKSKDKGIYRGINNAKYKIFTTLQREKLLKSISSDFSIDKYVNNFREKALIKKYFKTININLSRISVLSFLQHHRAPTPLIDFTRNIEIGIYFAIENLIAVKFEKAENEIDNYFSIFHISNENCKLIDIEKVIEGIEDLRVRWDQMIHDKEKHNTLLLRHIDEMTDINTMEVYLVNLENKFKSFSILNNIRILSQEGLFIHNDLGIKPLEIALKEFFKPATQFVGHEMDDMEDIPGIKERNDEYRENLDKNRIIQSKLSKNIIQSFEIHKSLIPDIIELLSVDKEYIYPDFEKLCESNYKEI